MFVNKTANFCSVPKLGTFVVLTIKVNLLQKERPWRKLLA